MIMKNSKVYDVLRFVAETLLPALAVAYMALGELWSLPHPEAISTTVMIIDTFLGTILGISAKKYEAMRSSKEVSEQ